MSTALAHTCAPSSRQAKDRAIGLLELLHAARHSETCAELKRLYLAAIDQIGARDSSREPHVILDTARRSSLASDRSVFYDQRCEPFGARIDGCRNSCRAAPNYQYVDNGIALDS